MRRKGTSVDQVWAWREPQWLQMARGAGIGTNKGVTEGRVPLRCSSLRHHPFPSIRVFYFSSALRPYIDMADAASGSTERSVQVKLVLLGG